MFKPLIVASVLLAGSPNHVATELDYQVGQSAREYRIQVYNSFRTDRDQFDQRQAAGQRALEAWKLGGRRPAESRQVIQWFEQARLASNAGQQALPPLPAFALSRRLTHDKSQHARWHGSNAPQLTQEQPRPATVNPPASPLAAPDINQPQTDPRPAATQPAEESGPSVVRGLGRALLKTVGVNAAPTTAGSHDQAPATPSPANAVEPTETETETQIQEPQVDVDDLKARIDGLNPSIATLASVLADNGPISTEQMTMLVEETEGLVQRYNDLQPYVQLPGLSAENRAYLGTLTSPKTTIDRLRQRIKQAAEELTPAEQSKGDDANATERSQLKQLLQRVEKLNIGS